MELVINDKNIRAYAYREIEGLTKIELTDEVEIIGEGAFYHCHDLRFIKVGHHVTSVHFAAFEGIGKNAHIIWLTKTPYYSMLYRILPNFEDIASICAPYLPFSKKTIHEKIALACGFILHPEYEKMYDFQLKKAYQLFILNELPQYLNILVHNDSIIDVFVLCRRRNLIKNKEIMKKYIAYSRTRKTSSKEKELLDKIELEENLLKKQQMTLQDQEIDKKLLRYINSYIDPAQMNQLLEKEKLLDLPHIYYKDSLRVMPEEALKFILYQYMKQWSYFDEYPLPFQYDKYADYIVNLVDDKSLQNALKYIVDFNTENNVTEDINIKYPRRLVPVLRYCQDDLLQFYNQKSYEYLNYEHYKKSGMIVSKTIQYAILLNQSSLAYILAFRNHMLNDYALIHHIKKENVFYRLVELLQHHQYALKEDFVKIEKEYRQYLYDAYVVKKIFTKYELKKAYQLHTLKAIMQTLLWQIKDTKNYFILQNNKINFIDDNDAIVLAYPAEMTDKDIKKWMIYFKNNHIQQFFPQIWIPKHRYYIDQMDFWMHRYIHLKVKIEKLQQLRNYHFQLQGSLTQGLKIIFYGKCILQAYPDNNDQTVILGVIQDASYRFRELNEALRYIDDVLCFELIASARDSAKNYVSRFNEQEISILLQKSIELHHQENVAILLEYQKQFIKQNDDLDLDW